MAKWTTAETVALCNLVKTHGFKWTLIASDFTNRTPAQVRTHWTFVCNSEGRANAGYARNRCGKCGQYKRGHVCGKNEVSPRQIAALVRSRRCNLPTSSKTTTQTQSGASSSSSTSTPASLSEPSNIPVEMESSVDDSQETCVYQPFQPRTDVESTRAQRGLRWELSGICPQRETTTSANVRMLNTFLIAS